MLNSHFPLAREEHSRATPLVCLNVLRMSKWDVLCEKICPDFK